ncbi:MAG: hypothetical protein KatS3mg124_1985 [Porticoccaceae bacterium]|nr:MAG: hypothetical protein KatS3mg124_1985 [Porticoccaceae bacterium]
MRWLALLLLVANLLPALFPGNRGWVVAQRPERGGARPEELQAPSLQLLAERTAESDGAHAERTPFRSGGHCSLLGPFGSVAAAERVALQFEARGVALRRHAREVGVGSDYWVYLPRPPSSRAAGRLLQELKAAGMEGYRIPAGPLAGAVGVAVYADAEAAERERQRLIALGYPAEVGRIERRALEFWLVGETLRPATLAAVERALGDRLPHRGVREDCQSVASAMHFQ